MPENIPVTNLPTTPLSTEELMAKYRERLSDRAANLSKQITAAPSNVIKLKGRVFTMPDGTTNPGPLKAVILDFVSFNSYFKGAYNANKPVPPVCWAHGDMDSLSPSANSPEVQHDGDCASCPKNQWGSATNGGKGKACKNQLKIAIMAWDLKTPDSSKIYLLNVSPTGIKIFSGFARRVQKSLGPDALPIRVVCDIGFDPQQTYPTLTFTEMGFNENLGVSLELLTDARELLMREPKGEEE